MGQGRITEMGSVLAFSAELLWWIYFDSIKPFLVWLADNLRKLRLDLPDADIIVKNS